MAFNWNKFPWTNLHDLNLDWIIQKVRELEIKVIDAAQYTDRKINDLLTGAGDLEIDKTGTVRISGGTVDLSNARMTTDFDMAEHRIINVGAPYREPTPPPKHMWIHTQAAGSRAVTLCCKAPLHLTATAASPMFRVLISQALPPPLLLT